MAAEGPSRKICLLATGAHCPPHLGHIEALKRAAEHFKSQGYEVEIFISPSQDGYVGPKMSTKKAKINNVEYTRPNFNIQQRFALEEALLRDEGLPINALDKNEGNGTISIPAGTKRAAPTYFEHWEVMADFSRRHPDATCVFVAGEDLAKGCLGSWRTGYHGPEANGMNFLLLGRTGGQGLDARTREDLQTRINSLKSDIHETIYSDQDPISAMSSTDIMSGKVEQLKEFGFHYITTLLDIIQKDNNIDPNYKKAFAGQVALALPLMNRLTPAQKEDVAKQILLLDPKLAKQLRSLVDPSIQKEAAASPIKVKAASEDEIINFIKNVGGQKGKGTWDKVGSWEVGQSNYSGNPAIANNQYQIELTGEGKLIYLDKSTKPYSVMPPEKAKKLSTLLDETTKKSISAWQAISDLRHIATVQIDQEARSRAQGHNSRVHSKAQQDHHNRSYQIIRARLENAGLLPQDISKLDQLAFQPWHPPVRKSAAEISLGPSAAAVLTGAAAPAAASPPSPTGSADSSPLSSTTGSPETSPREPATAWKAAAVSQSPRAQKLPTPSQLKLGTPPRPPEPQAVSLAAQAAAPSDTQKAPPRGKLERTGPLTAAQIKLAEQIATQPSIKVEQVEAFKDAQKNQHLNNAAQIQINCPPSILAAFRQLVRESQLPGKSFTNPYTGKTEKLPDNPDAFTAQHLQILARNEDANGSGRMKIDMYDGLLTPDQVAELRCLVKATTVSGLTPVYKVGGYPAGNPVRDKNPPSNMIIVDQAGLQWQNDFRNTGGMFFYPDLEHPESRIDYASRNGYGENYLSWQNKMFQQMYGQPRPPSASNNSLEIQWNGLHGKLDLDQVAMAIKAEFMQALESAARQGDAELGADQKMNFRYLKAGMGFFISGLRTNDLECQDHPMILLARLNGIESALRMLSTMDEGERKTLLGKIGRIEFPFSEEPNHPEITAKIQSIEKLATRMGLEWGGAGRKDALEDIPGFVTAVTNTADPHAMIGNEGAYGSVDAMIACNAAINHFNAAANDKIGARQSLEPHYNLETTDRFKNTQDIKYHWPKRGATQAEREKAQASKEGTPIMEYAQFDNQHSLKITCKDEASRKQLLERLNREAKNNKVKIDFVKDKSQDNVFYIPPTKQLKKEPPTFSAGVYVSRNGELSVNLGNNGFRDFFAQTMHITNTHAQLVDKGLGENAIYFKKTTLEPRESPRFLVAKPEATPASTLAAAAAAQSPTASTAQPVSPVRRQPLLQVYHHEPAAAAKADKTKNIQTTMPSLEEQVAKRKKPGEH